MFKKPKPVVIVFFTNNSKGKRKKPCNNEKEKEKNINNYLKKLIPKKGIQIIKQVQEKSEEV